MTYTHFHLRLPTLSLSLATSLALVACSPGAPSPAQAPSPQPTAIATLTAAPAPTQAPTQIRAARTTVAANGTLALRTAPLSLGADLGAKVLSVNVEPGQAVNVGDVLATLDDTSLQDALADAKLQLALAEAQATQAETPASPEDIASAKAALAAAQANYAAVKRGPTTSEIEQARLNWVAARDAYLAAQVNRDAACGTALGTNTPFCQAQEASYGNAYERERAALANYQQLQQPVTQEQLTQAYASVVSAQARLQSLEAGISEEQKGVNEARLNQARSAVRRAEDNLRQAIVRSPCDCVVQEVNVAVGSVPRGVAFTLINLDGLQFKTNNLTERELASIKIGDRATIRLRAFDASLSGTVSAILPQSTGAQGGAALFTVLIALDPTDARLLPGMTGQAEIEASR